MIYHRKSCRSFTGQPVAGSTIEKILSFGMKPLYPQIKVRMDIVSRDKVKCICPWMCAHGQNLRISISPAVKMCRCSSLTK